MHEHYLLVKQLHVALALMSGALFAVRGLTVLGGMRWAMAAPVRYLSYGIDFVLLASALALLQVLRLNPFTQPWLAVKLTSLAAYIVLGSLSLRRARDRRTRRLAFAAALACFGFLYSVARTHHPLGALLWLGG